MSNQKTCSKCGFNNSPSSKFCNNCGNKLPLSTHIICPNCETTNAIDRIFCDNCGSRLLQDDPLPEDPQQESSPKSGSKAFSLPTRRPGDTGELDPNTLPEWLKTGKTDNVGQFATPDEEDSQKPSDIDIGDSKPLHKLEELTADKNLTDDLPDWLVKNSDSDPIIAAPDAISTELYLDLVDKAEDINGSNLPFDASDANLPDWLAEAGKFEETSITPSESDTGKLPQMPEAEAIEEEAVESENLPESSSGLTDWLSELNQLSEDDKEAPSDDSGREESDWLQEIEEESAAEPGAWTSWLEMPEEQVEEELSEDTTDGTDDLADEIARNLAAEQSQVSADFSELFQADDSSDADDLPDWMANMAASDESLIAPDSEKMDEDLFSLEEDAAQSELDWLMQTGGLTISDETDETDELDVPTDIAEQLPGEDADNLDWLSELASLDTSSLQEADKDIAEEVAQPDELDEIGETTESRVEVDDALESETPTPAKGFTDWLEFADELEEAQLEAQAEGQLADNEETFSEWDGLLSELRSSDPPQDSPQTELPDWISDLKPDARVEPLEPTTPVDETAPVETEGPLAGLRGVINVEPVITLMRDEPEIPSFMVSPEQRQQLELLRQLSHDDAKSISAEVASTQSTMSLTRILLAFLLFAAVLVGFLLPELLPQRPIPEQPKTVDAFTAVNEVAGKTVLVAFDYTPALAGELAPQSQLLLNHLAQNGNNVVAITQHAAGTALAATALEEHGGNLLGYLPGEAIGLRQLSGCLNQKADACTMISSWAGNDDIQTVLSDVSIILVFTGQRDSLIHWVEQVGATTDIPVVMGITQALEPVATPYYVSGQLAGMIAGAPATAVYDTLVNSNNGDTTQLLSTQLLSQTMGQIMVVAIFIVGLFIYGIVYPLANQQRQL